MRIKYLIITVILFLFNCKKIVKELGEELSEEAIEYGIKNSAKKNIDILAVNLAAKQSKELSEKLGKETKEKITKEVIDKHFEKTTKKLGEELFNEGFSTEVSKKALYRKIVEAVEKNQVKDLLQYSKLPKELIEKVSKMNKNQQVSFIFDLSKANPKAKSLLIFITENADNFKAYSFLSGKNTSYSVRSNRSYLEQIVSQFKKGINPPQVKLNSYGKSLLNKKRKVQIDGVIYLGLFPDFSKYRKVQMRLPKEYYLKSRKEHFKYLDKELARRVTENPEFAKKFTKEEITNIKLGKGLKGHTWHHNEAKGVMDLVKSEVHNSPFNSHIGGNALWAKGTLDL